MKTFFLKFKNYLIDIGLLKWISDETYLKYLYKKEFKIQLNLKEPKTFTEKLQWYKLYYKNPEMNKMVDKYEVKQFVKNQINNDDLNIIPTIGIFDRFEDINFEELPNEFVMKCTHDSGSVTIIKDKRKINYKKLKRYFKLKMKINFYNRFREWPYKDVKPRILIEKIMKDDEADELTDYKFFCFNGEPRLMYISKDASNEPRTDFFDMNYNHLDLYLKDKNADITPVKPKKFEIMKGLATQLAQDFPFIRIDFYVINDKIYFGEYTFYHLGGFFKLHPESWNIKLGELMNIKEL